jgi:hypothetical protein
MHRTLCLWSAAALLVGALAIGNPLLPRPSAAAKTPATVRDSSPAEAAVQPASWRDGAVARGAPAAVAFAVHGGAVATPPCPDPLLAPLVVAVERNDEHGVVYVLRDGRRMTPGRDPMGPALVELAPAPPR